MRIETRETTHGFKCVCCGEYIKTCEKYLQVMNGNKPVRGEKYCVDCEEPARQNNDVDTDDREDDGERFLRQMENWADYSAAGCPDAYWTDRDAGYVE